MQKNLRILKNKRTLTKVGFIVLALVSFLSAAMISMNTFILPYFGNAINYSMSKLNPVEHTSTLMEATMQNLPALFLCAILLCTCLWSTRKIMK